MDLAAGNREVEAAQGAGGSESLLEPAGDDDIAREIAAAAEVSPSSIYRYFVTKEGIVFHDEYDDELLGLLPALLADHSPYDAARAGLRAIAEAHFVSEREMTARRTRLWLGNPQIRKSVHVFADELSQHCVQTLMAAQPGRYDTLTAHTVVSSIIWGLIAALSVWHEEGGTGEIMAAFERAIEVLEAGGR